MFINGKFPDFTNINGQKKVILLNGTFWHTKFAGREKLSRQEIEELERKPYKEFGYSVLHIWEDELNNIELLKSKIKEFNNIQNREELKYVIKNC